MTRVAVLGTETSRLEEALTLLDDAEVVDCQPEFVVVLPDADPRDHAQALKLGIPTIEVHP